MVENCEEWKNKTIDNIYSMQCISVNISGKEYNLAIECCANKNADFFYIRKMTIFPEDSIPDKILDRYNDYKKAKV